MWPQRGDGEVWWWIPWSVWRGLAAARWKRPQLLSFSIVLTLRIQSPGPESCLNENTTERWTVSRVIHKRRKRRNRILASLLLNHLLVLEKPIGRRKKKKTFFLCTSLYFFNLLELSLTPDVFSVTFPNEDERKNTRRRRTNDNEGIKDWWVTEIKYKLFIICNNLIVCSIFFKFIGQNEYD